MSNLTPRDKPATSDSKKPTWKRLIDPPLAAHEFISILRKIVTNEHKVDVICGLGEADAQNVINKMHEVRSTFYPSRDAI